MKTAAVVSEQEYLQSSYDPDCELVDGQLVATNAGKRQHGILKFDDYLQFGVEYVWIIDPERRKADVYTTGGFYEAKDLILRTEDPPIQLPLADLFQALDE